MEEILRPRCAICGDDHPENFPHNPFGEQYRVWFLERYGRYPSWDDAMTHCSEDVKLSFKQTMERVKKHTEEVLGRAIKRGTCISHSGKTVVISDKGSSFDAFSEVTLEVQRPFSDEWVTIAKLENRAIPNNGSLYDGWNYRLNLTYK